MATETQLIALIAGLPDVLLKDILRLMVGDVADIKEELDPITKLVGEIVKPEVIPGLPPTRFEARFPAVPADYINLHWQQGDDRTFCYELRESTNDVHVWDTSSFILRTVSTEVDISTRPAGKRYFLLKTILPDGSLSEAFALTEITVLAPIAPSMSAQVIDNNVLLTWAPPTVASFAISHYNVYRNDTLIGALKGTFTTTFETVAGTYTYSVYAVDVHGNIGAPGYVTAIVNTPPDYALQDYKISDLNGTRWNVGLLPGPALLACWKTQTFEQHFQTRSWINIKAQQNAGYPIYIQPSEVNGSYEEIVDYGAVFTNVIANISWQQEVIVGDTSIVVKMCYSNDYVNWTPLVIGASQYIPEMRYLLFQLLFTNSDDKALLKVYNLTISLDVKRENDGGDLIAVATDVGGTPVYFLKPFKDVESITATADGIEPIIIIYDFVDVPNPTTFYVYALDSTGNRVTYPVSWKARGIV